MLVTSDPGNMLMLVRYILYDVVCMTRPEMLLWPSFSRGKEIVGIGTPIPTDRDASQTAIKCHLASRLFEGVCRCPVAVA
jgi:hypothetical protein